MPIFSFYRRFYATLKRDSFVVGKDIEKLNYVTNILNGSIVIAGLYTSNIKVKVSNKGAINFINCNVG